MLLSFLIIGAEQSGLNQNQPRKIPWAERLAGIEKQKEELKGLVMDAANEPSHALVDKFQCVIDDGYVTPSARKRATKRDLMER